jgi:hypothetical protein
MGEMQELSKPGYYNRKNPNWVSVTPPRRMTPLADDDDNVSLVPTMLVDPEDEEDTPIVWKRESTAVIPPDPYDDSISLRIARTRPSVQMIYDTLGPQRPPLAGLYPASSSQLTMLERGAASLGLHMGAIRTPRDPLKEEMQDEDGMLYNRAKRLGSAPSFWAVVGRDKKAVDHLCELQRGHDTGNIVGAPGSLCLKTEPYNLGTPRGLVWTQLVFATVVGGAIMFWILSLA